MRVFRPDDQSRRGQDWGLRRAETKRGGGLYLVEDCEGRGGRDGGRGSFRRGGSLGSGRRGEFASGKSCEGGRRRRGTVCGFHLVRGRTQSASPLREGLAEYVADLARSPSQVVGVVFVRRRGWRRCTKSECNRVVSISGQRQDLIERQVLHVLIVDREQVISLYDFGGCGGCGGGGADRAYVAKPS